MNLAIRILTYITIVITLSMTNIFCNSSENPKISEAESACNSYNYYYDDLKKFIADIKSNSNSVSYMPDAEKFEKINIKLSELNKINCSEKKDLTFANDMITWMKQEKANKEQQYDLDRLNGDDLGMEGVTISSPEILFYENMDSYVKVTLSNQTKKRLKSLKFGVNYCVPKYYSPLCYKTVVVTINVNPMSSESFTFDMPSKMPGQSDYPKIKLLEVVRSDGTKAKTGDGIRFSIDPANNIN
jgi:hypothetical protein